MTWLLLLFFLFRSFPPFFPLSLSPPLSIPRPSFLSASLSLSLSFSPFLPLSLLLPSFPPLSLTFIVTGKESSRTGSIAQCTEPFWWARCREGKAWKQEESCRKETQQTQREETQRTSREDGNYGEWDLLLMFFFFAQHLKCTVLGTWTTKCTFSKENTTDHTCAVKLHNVRCVSRVLH